MVKKINIKQTEKNHLCFNKDCIELLNSIKENDIIYIDPPYNTGKDFIYKDIGDNMRLW